MEAISNKHKNSWTEHIPPDSEASACITVSGQDVVAISTVGALAIGAVSPESVRSIVGHPELTHVSGFRIGLPADVVQYIRGCNAVCVRAIHPLKKQLGVRQEG
jgi:hypothetical protein